MIINRKLENNEIQLHDHKAVEGAKDKMDDLRRERSATWTDKAIPTTSNAEVPL